MLRQHPLPVALPGGEVSVLLFSPLGVLCVVWEVLRAVGPPAVAAQLVLPEYLIHLLYNVLFLASGELFTLLLNLPLILYHINRYRQRPVMSVPGLYDPTSIMNAEQLSRAMREGWVKLAFYLLSFFYYLYGMIHSLITVD